MGQEQALAASTPSVEAGSGLGSRGGGVGQRASILTPLTLSFLLSPLQCPVGY